MNIQEVAKNTLTGKVNLLIEEFCIEKTQDDFTVMQNGRNKKPLRFIEPMSFI